MALSAEEWRTRLLAKLTGRRRRAQRYFAYYDGDHPAQRLDAKQRDAFRAFLRESRANWVALVVDAVADRLAITGFRFGESLDADGDAWKIWQASHLDADHQLVNSDALTVGSSFVSVWPDDSNPSGVLIAAETPLETVVAYRAGSRWDRVAALKAWYDDGEATSHAVLFFPDAVFKWATRGNIHDGTGGQRLWEPEPEPGEDWPLRNPIGTVPVVELQPRPRVGACGLSEMDGVTDIQDRINNTLLERGVATNAAAFKQKWATGMDIPRDPKTGKEVEPYEQSVRRLWIAEAPDTKFGEFAESDLTNYIQLIESDVNALAAISKTPPTYLLGAMVNLSGDAIRTAETSLIKKVMTRRDFLSESWEEVMRLALLFLGDERGHDASSEIMWADPAVRTEGELVDALTKMATLGVPEPELWRRWGASEQQIREWKAAKAADQFAALLNSPPVVPPQPGQQMPPQGEQMMRQGAPGR